jgi:DNA-binding CsgD family transcriptional regulator
MNKQNMRAVTNRELEVLFWLSNGLSTKEIAGEMNISPRTVEDHISNVRQKTSLYRRSQLVSFYRTKVA